MYVHVNCECEYEWGRECVMSVCGSWVCVRGVYGCVCACVCVRVSE